MHTLDDLIVFWKNNTKPPDLKPNSYDDFVSIGFSDLDITLSGLISWDDGLQLYTFHFMNESSDLIGKFEIKYGCAILSPDEFKDLCEMFSENYGINSIKGIYSKDSPPALPDKTDFYLESETGRCN